MSQRQRKRTVSKLFHNRMYNTRFIWWSAEDRAWANLAPIGREFGSPDYERLEQDGLLPVSMIPSTGNHRTDL